MNKKLMTRNEFEAFREEAAERMASDNELAADSRDVLIRADRYSWIHQTTWMGEPVLNLPQDMFALQEIIYNTRPDFVIELGVAWGGSLLFHASIMETLGHGKVIGVDIFIPEDLKQRIFSHGKLSDRITLVTGSSTDDKTISTIKERIGQSRKLLIVLDSFHTHEHVLKELTIYSSLVGKGFYIVCCDTLVENIPVQAHRQRPWGPGDNPMTALREFLGGSIRFRVDEKLNNKLLMSCNPSGYLVCVQDSE